MPCPIQLPVVLAFTGIGIAIQLAPKGSITWCVAAGAALAFLAPILAFLAMEAASPERTTDKALSATAPSPDPDREVCSGLRVPASPRLARGMRPTGSSADR